MNKLILAFLIALQLILPFSASAAEVQSLNWSEVQDVIRQNTSRNIVIEFYSSKADGLECDRCQSQESVLRSIARQYGDKIAFIRVDVANTPHLKEMGIVGIYPTHLFVRHKVPGGQEMVAKRIRGFLTEKDYHSLIEEFFEIKR
ncbi:MAG: thioredoxin family protein [Cyanobacteria bacterium]|nr:thioredoxin family protein [Cyanobacteriota bacterium]